MLILTIRTDKPEAELGLYNDAAQLAYFTWQAHRELAETIHLKLKDLLTDQGERLSDIQGIVVFKGPGSFTGLRIGASVANALADSLQAAIVGTIGEKWLPQGIERLLAAENDQAIIPEYGSLPHITQPRK